MAGHHGDGIRNLNRGVLAFKRSSRGSRQTRRRRGGLQQRQRSREIGGACGVSAVQGLNPRTAVFPSARIVPGDRNRGHTVTVHVAEATSHSRDRFVLSSQLLVVLPRALGYENRLI